jgi:DNA-binding transcriptional LysR family regulator
LAAGLLIDKAVATIVWIDAMNIHHLELFYYVAKHRGISEAVRNIPYGIQQPAMSGQIIQLEDFLGVPLFQRRPFALTPAGEQLYEFIKPFFDNLQSVSDKLRGGTAHQIRVGASEVVLRDHLPDVLDRLRKKFPGMKLLLREGYHPQLLSWLEKKGIDIAITLLDRRPAAGVKSLPLFDLPLVLLVPADSAIKSAEQLWKQDRIGETLISLPTNEPIYKNFQEGLARLKVDWFTSIEVSTVQLVECYVNRGYGIGLSIAAPNTKLGKNVRVLPLEGFQPVAFGVHWSGKPSAIVQALLDNIQSFARDLTVRR